MAKLVIPVAANLHCEGCANSFYACYNEIYIPVYTYIFIHTNMKFAFFHHHIILLHIRCNTSLTVIYFETIPLNEKSL